MKLNGKHRNEVPAAKPETVLTLLSKYPEISMSALVVELSEDGFRRQENKQNQYPIEGGALGIVRTGEAGLVLTHRSGPHFGWALPGGRVELREEFDAAALREIEEEIGVKPVLDSALSLEYKTFRSPNGDELRFWLAVFVTHLPAMAVPFSTEEAVREGLTVGIFHKDRLPESMVESDRRKISLALRLL